MRGNPLLRPGATSICVDKTKNNYKNGISEKFECPIATLQKGMFNIARINSQ